MKNHDFVYNWLDTVSSLYWCCVNGHIFEVTNTGVLQKAKAQCEETESINQHPCNAEAQSICCSSKTQGNPDINPEQAQTSRIACREARGQYIIF